MEESLVHLIIIFRCKQSLVAGLQVSNCFAGYAELRRHCFFFFFSLYCCIVLTHIDTTKPRPIDYFVLFVFFCSLDFPSFSSLQTWVCSPTPPLGLAVSLKCAAVVVIVAPPRFALGGNLISQAAAGLGGGTYLRLFCMFTCMHATNKLVNPQPFAHELSGPVCSLLCRSTRCRCLTSA